MSPSNHTPKSILLMVALVGVLGWIAYNKLLRPDFSAPSQVVG